MKKLIPMLVLTTLLLAACGDMEWVTAAPDIYRITPSRPPTILTQTPAIAYPTTSATLPPPPSLTPNLTVFPSLTPSLTAIVILPATPTITETPPPPPTSTVAPLPVEVTLLGCDTGIDITHGMGEVTNAYVVIANRASPELVDLCATLSSTDEGRIHPDKTICIASLPPAFQVTLKLTVDTTYQVNTIIGIKVTSVQGTITDISGLACKDIGASKPAPETIGVLQPVP